MHSPNLAETLIKLFIGQSSVKSGSTQCDHSTPLEDTEFQLTKGTDLNASTLALDSTREIQDLPKKSETSYKRRRKYQLYLNLQLLQQY